MNIRKLKSSQLDAAIYGMLLGDGSCDRGEGNFTKNSNFILKVGHSKKQEEYLLWKKKIVDQIGTVSTKVWEYDKQNAVYFRTNARKYFTKLEKIFYTNRKKNVSLKILNKLNDLSLAIWFMDDGYISCNKSGSCYGELCTDQFNIDQVKMIQKWFIDKYKLNVGIRELKYKSGKYYGKVVYRIKFNSENCKKLKNIIYPFVNQISCMKYKLSKVK